MKKIYYLSINGKKNDRFCLRLMTIQNGILFREKKRIYTDFVRQLPNDLTRATERAQEYFDSLEREEDFEYVLDLSPNDLFNFHQMKCDHVCLVQLRCLEEGYFCFGIHTGSHLKEVPDQYLKYWSNYVEKENFFIQTVRDYCRQEIERRGLLETEQNQIQEREEIDRRSNHIGEIGERLEMSGTIFSVIHKEGYVQTMFRDKDENIIVYRGNFLSDKGNEVSIVARIKRHETYGPNQIKRTAITYPKMKGQ